VRRIGEHLVKAAREAKRLTGWIDPDPSYEHALTDFASQLLADDAPRAVLSGVVDDIATAAATNSLAAALLRIAAPGVPDVYQGDDLWQLALVDPDNRRPLDLEAHRAALTSLDQTPMAELLASWQDGRIKQAVIRAVLDARRRHPEIFAAGDYLPLDATGAAGGHVVAFGRRSSAGSAVVVLPRLAQTLVGPGAFPVGIDAWDDCVITLPSGDDAVLTDVITGRRHEHRGELRVAEVLADLPVALLLRS
jgi:(1->4)-alpha-D-glucan 1-alpha-D-glucosylmutase